MYFYKQTYMYTKHRVITRDDQGRVQVLQRCFGIIRTDLYSIL